MANLTAQNFKFGVLYSDVVLGRHTASMTPRARLAMEEYKMAIVSTGNHCSKDNTPGMNNNDSGHASDTNNSGNPSTASNSPVPKDVQSELELLPAETDWIEWNNCRIDNFVEMDSICRFKKLVGLNLAQNDLSWIPFDMTSVPSLAYLNLNDNNIVGLPDKFALLTHFKDIRLANNSLCHIASNTLGTSPALEVLDLRCNLLKDLPNQFNACKTLRYLDVTDNRFERPLPNWLSNCTKLEVLLCQHNEFKTNPLPTDFGPRNQSLRLVVMSKFTDSALPFPVHLTQQLQFLDCGSWGERGQVLPQHCMNYQQLHIFYPSAQASCPPRCNLSGERNYLFKIDRKYQPLTEQTHQGAILDWQLLGTTPMTQLILLKLDNCRLDHIPDKIGDTMPKLELIDFNYNQIKTIPSTFAKLTNLRYVFLNGNQITGLPANFGELTKLTELHLACNRITSLPASFDRLVRIRVIDVRSNPIYYCPAVFYSLPRLKSLGCPTMENLFIKIDHYSKYRKFRDAYLRGLYAPMAGSKTSKFYARKKNEIIKDVLGSRWN